MKIQSNIKVRIEFSLVLSILFLFSCDSTKINNWNGIEHVDLDSMLYMANSLKEYKSDMHDFSFKSELELFSKGGSEGAVAFGDINYSSHIEVEVWSIQEYCELLDNPITCEGNLDFDNVDYCDLYYKNLDEGKYSSIMYRCEIDDPWDLEIDTLITKKIWSQKRQMLYEIMIFFEEGYYDQALLTAHTFELVN